MRFTRHENVITLTTNKKTIFAVFNSFSKQADSREICQKCLTCFENFKGMEDQKQRNDDKELELSQSISA